MPPYFLPWVVLTEVMNKFLNAQMEDPKAGDWWLQVKKDIEELELNLSLHDIKLMSHEKLQKTVQQSVKVAAFRWLSEKKSNSKKVKNIPHGRLEIVKYLSDHILSNFCSA